MLLLAAAPADAAADNYLLAAACWLLPIIKHIIFAVVAVAAVVAVVAVIAVFAVLALVAVFTAQNMPNGTCYFNDAVVSMYYDVNTLYFCFFCRGYCAGICAVYIYIYIW